MRQPTEGELDVLDTLRRMGVEASSANITEMLSLLFRHDARTRAKDLAVMARNSESSGNHDPLVYFVRNGSLVKIGTTVNLKKRMRKLSMSMANVLRTEPGGQEVERSFHQRFADYREGNREWFRLEGALAEFLGVHPPVKKVTNRRTETPIDDLPAMVFGLLKARTEEGGLTVDEVRRALTGVYGEEAVPVRQTITRWLRQDNRVHKPTGYGRYTVRPEFLED